VNYSYKFFPCLWHPISRRTEVHISALSSKRNAKLVHDICQLMEVLILMAEKGPVSCTFSVMAERFWLYRNLIEVPSKLHLLPLSVMILFSCSTQLVGYVMCPHVRPCPSHVHHKAPCLVLLVSWNRVGLYQIMLSPFALSDYYAVTALRNLITYSVYQGRNQDFWCGRRTFFFFFEMFGSIDLYKYINT
jgi:hypothetical protein